MNEEEVQTALSCETEDPPKRNAKMYVERDAQTTFSYTPNASSTAIRTELRTKYPDHDQTAEPGTTLESVDENDGDVQGVATDASGTEVDPCCSEETKLTLVVTTLSDEDGVDTIDGMDATNIENFTEIESNVSFFPQSARNSVMPPNDIDEEPSEPVDGEGNATAEDELIQTGIVLGTGTVAPGQEKAATSSDDAKSKETSVQTKFGGYPVDQSDTLIVEELQSRYPVHSQDVVLEDDGPKPEEGEAMPPPDEEPGEPPETDAAPVAEENAADDVATEETTEDTAEDQEPASPTGNAVDSMAQTVFTYDPLLSNSQLVDELANAYPQHSTENALMTEDEPPPPPPEDDAIPTSKSESRDSFNTALTSEPNMEDVEPQDTTEEEAQTGIVCGGGKTCPDSTRGNAEELEGDTRERSMQTVFGGYNVDQSDTKIITELQFEDPVHSRRGSLEPVAEAEPNPTEDAGEVEAEPEEGQDVEATPEEDVPLDASETVEESLPEPEGTEENIEPVEENEEEGEGENAIVEETQAETSETDDDDGIAVQTTLTCASDTAEDLETDDDDGTGVQTMLTCASLEDYPLKATRYVEENTQTVFSYDPDLSNTLILAELRTKQPEHEEPSSELPATAEADENAETDNPDEAEGGEGEAVPAEEGAADETTPESPPEETGDDAVEEPDVVTEDAPLPPADEVPEEEAVVDETTPDVPPEETGDDDEQPQTEGEVGAEVAETESAQFNENIQTDITCGVGSTAPLALNMDKTQQTFFSYDSRVSNSEVIPELQSGQPVHSQLAVENAGDDDADAKDSCRGPCSKYAKQSGGSQLPAVVERPDISELDGMSSKQKLDMVSRSHPVIGSESDDSKSRARAVSYPLDKNQAAEMGPLVFTTEEETADGDETQDTGAQTQIIFGTGTSPQGINEKASNTYFTYDPTESDTQVLEELRTREPVHSGEAVPFVAKDENKVPGDSEESLFNDDWEKNESSGEGEVEVQDINATTSKASDWLPGASDVEASDTEAEPGVQLTLVVESEDLEEDDGKQKAMIQTDLSFGDTLGPLQQNASSVSVHIMFTLQVGNDTETMQLNVPKSGLDPSEAALKATFNAEFAGGGLDEPVDKEGRETIRCTLPILVTVTCESSTDDSGNTILEPVVDLIFQKPPSRLTRALENQPQGEEQDRLPDENASQSEDKREIEIQTDLVLGALLFSESISSVGGEEGFDTASEGPMHDEELNLPSPPMDEPCSRTDVSWGQGSLEDVDNEAVETYDDLHLLVDPNDACNQQYVQQLVPDSSSQENFGIKDNSKGTLMKITTAELLYVPDKVSSLTARNTDAKKVKVTTQKLHRWGFPNESNPSNLTVLPDSYNVNGEQLSTGTVLDNGNDSPDDTRSGKIVTAVATRVFFEFHTSSEEDVSSNDGRTPAVKSKIAFQVLGSRAGDNRSSHIATLDVKECIAPSKVTFISDGETRSKVLQPEGSPLELPIDADVPLVLKLSLPHSRPLDESFSTPNTSVRRVPFTISQVGDETLTTTKDLQTGGSALQFTVPLGDGYGTMTVSAKLEDNSSDEESSEVITMTTTLEEVDAKMAPTDGSTPTKGVCACSKSKSPRTSEKTDEKLIPLEEGAGKSKTITAMFIKDGVPGEKQTKVLRPGGSPMYVNLPSSGDVPVRAKLALAAQPTEEDANESASESPAQGADLKTKVSCKIIQDGVEKETKTKLMEAGGSPLRFDLPIGTDGGRLTANVIIPKAEDGSAGGEEECICEPEPADDACTCPDTNTPKKGEESKRPPGSGDRCFDVITEALATYAREIDPLRRALEEITEKVKELNVPELAGIGEPPTMSYHSLDSLERSMSSIEDLMPPSCKITLQSGASRISTTFQSRPNIQQQRPISVPSRSQAQRQWQGAPQYPADMARCQQLQFQNPAGYSPPPGSRPQGRCPLAPPPNQYPTEQLYMQRPAQPRCPYGNQQAYGQDPRGAGYSVGVRVSQQPPAYQYPPQQGYPPPQQGYPPPRQDYYNGPPAAFNISYIPQDGPPAHDPRSGQMRSCSPDTGYEEYGPQPRSPIAEMYIKLAQQSRSSQFYEEDEDSLYDDEDDDDGYGCQRRGGHGAPQKKKSKYGARDDRRKGGKPPRGPKGCNCSVSATDVATSITAIELDQKESYWCDPEDVTGSTKPGNLGNAIRHGSRS